MKRTLLSVKEIVQELGVSVQSIRRVYWRREVPAYRISTMLRFNLDHAQRILLAKGYQRSHDHEVRDRRPRPAARPANRPRSVKRGRNFHGSSRRNV